MSRGVSPLTRSRVCGECGKTFVASRTGRPRMTCGPQCNGTRVAKKKALEEHWARCAWCRRSHEITVCGAGYRYCPRTGTHFRPEQIEEKGTRE